MFDLIFSVFEAWNVLGLILMASVFLVIGGGMVGYFLFWSLKARKIKGRVAGIKMVGNASRNDDSNPADPPVDGKGALPIVMILFFILFPMIFMGIGVWMAYTYYDLTSNGFRVEANVVRNESSTDSDGNTSYKTVVSFTDRNGASHEVRDTISYGSSPSFDIGSRIGVYYDPDDPTRFVLDDFWHNMGISIAFIAFSSVFILIFSSIAIYGNKPARKGLKGKVSKGGYGQETYYPVFEYRTPQGERAEFTGSVGGNTFLHILPGTPVSLLMIPGDPPKVKKRGYISLIFGLIFLIPGLFIGQMALAQFKFSFGVVLLIGGAVAFIFFKAVKFLDKIPSEDKRKGWEALRSGEAFNSENFKVTSKDNSSKGRLLTSGEIRDRTASQVKVTRISGYIMLLLVLGLSIGAYYAGLSMLSYVNEGISVRGEVTGLRSKRSDDSTVYHALVKFTDKEGKERRFEDSVGSSHPSYKQGDDVAVLYLPDSPGDAIIDRGIWNWTLSGLLAAGAFFLLWAALASFRTVARAERSVSFRTAL
ncbi:MAG: DUF3592 domain-containing protein [Alphaproteobacteria bacterium]|nr:DUF3592 domain-containing protein [Alphaproteobacteria bacterium]MCB9974568.1 DUF3592 domain-containing protein [Rhodospirillales bacterium]